MKASKAGERIIENAAASRSSVEIVEIEFIAEPEVRKISGISHSELWRRVKVRTFPAPVKLGERRCTRWARHEVQAWALQRLAERDARNAA
jgi:prophage regulatory protein